MSKLRRWSIASAACRLEWRPSRVEAACLIALAMLAPLALLASALPRALAWPLALLALGHGLHAWRRQRRLAPRQLLWPGGPRLPSCDGRPMHGLRAHWRGGLVLLQWRDADGRRRSAVFWPDTLPAAARRELRLALLHAQAAPATTTVAP